MRFLLQHRICGFAWTTYHLYDTIEVLMKHANGDLNLRKLMNVFDTRKHFLQI